MSNPIKPSLHYLLQRPVFAPQQGTVRRPSIVLRDGMMTSRFGGGVICVSVRRLDLDEPGTYTREQASEAQGWARSSLSSFLVSVQGNGTTQQYAQGAGGGWCSFPVPSGCSWSLTAVGFGNVVNDNLAADAVNTAVTVERVFVSAYDCEYRRREGNTTLVAQVETGIPLIVPVPPGSRWLQVLGRPGVAVSVTVAPGFTIALTAAQVYDRPVLLPSNALAVQVTAAAADQVAVTFAVEN